MPRRVEKEWSYMETPVKANNPRADYAAASAVASEVASRLKGTAYAKARADGEAIVSVLRESRRPRRVRHSIYQERSDKAAAQKSTPMIVGRVC